MEDLRPWIDLSSERPGAYLIRLPWEAERYGRKEKGERKDTGLRKLSDRLARCPKEQEGAGRVGCGGGKLVKGEELGLAGERII